MNAKSADAEAGPTGIAWIKPREADREALRSARSRTLWQVLLDAAAFDPGRDAIVAADDEGCVRRLTYEQLLERVRHLSAGLASIGVRRGDRVALWMTNRVEWVLSCFAAVRLGASVVPINTFLKPPEVRYCLAQSGARHIVMLDRFRKLDFPAMLGEFCPEFAAAREPGDLYARELPDLRNVIVHPREHEAPQGAFDLAALEAIGREDRDGWLTWADRAASEVSPDDLIMIKYTSGSTGFPKGVMLQQGGFAANGILHAQRTGMRREDIYFSMMPLFHAGGSIYGLMSMLPQGGTLVFTEAFDAELAIRLIQEEKPTLFISVLGAEVVEAAYEKGLRFPTIRMAPIHNDRAREVMPNAQFAFSPFGLTETYGPAAITGPLDPAEAQRSTGGRPLPGNEIRVVDPETGLDLAPGEIGEAWIRGNTMLGYWNKPEETARVLDGDGWVHSEDLVTVDEDGFVTYQGRIKLMAKVGGENVSLEEVERCASGHEAIMHCAAVGVPDARKKEAVRLYAVRSKDIAIAEADLVAWLKPRLAHFKLPREVIFVHDLPRLGSGKLDRMGIAAMAAGDARN